MFIYFFDAEESWPFKKLCNVISSKNNHLDDFKDLISENRSHEIDIQSLIPDSEHFFENLINYINQVLESKKVKSYDYFTMFILSIIKKA